MKKIFSLCLPVLLSWGTHALAQTVKWGEPAGISTLEMGPYPVGATANHFYAEVTQIRNNSFQTYDLSTLSLKSKDDFKLKYNGQDLQNLSSFIFNDRLTFISYAIGTDKTTRTYILHEMQNKQLKNEIELAEVSDNKKKRNLILYDQYLTGKRFSATVSPDRRSLCVLFLDSDDESDEGKFNMVWFNADRKETHRTTGTLGKFSIDEVQLNNSGRLYLLGHEVIPAEKGKEPQMGNYHLRVYDKGVAEDLTVNTELSIDDINMVSLPDGTAVLYGLQGSKEGKPGWFVIKTDAKHEPVMQENDFFGAAAVSPERLIRPIKKTEQRLTGDGVYRYILHGMQILPDGDFVFLAEQRYTFKTYPANMEVPLTHVYTDDIVAIRLTPQGKTVWQTVIPKRQYGDAGFASFFTFRSDDGLYFIYNELEKPDGSTVPNVRECNAANIIHLTADGKWTQSQLYDLGKKGGARSLMPDYCIKLNDSEVLLFTNASISSNVRTLGKITFH